MDQTSEREFMEFVSAARPRLGRIAALLTNDVHAAEDLVQTALLKVYRSWHRVSDNPASYARRVMINQRTDWWRRGRGREKPVAALVDRPSKEDFTAQHADRDFLARSLAELTRRERALLVLRFLEDLSIEDTANELGITSGAVKSGTSRLLAKLRIDLAEPKSAEPDCTEPTSDTPVIDINNGGRRRRAS